MSADRPNGPPPMMIDDAIIGWSVTTELAREFGVTRQYIGQLVRKEWRRG